MPEPCVYIVDDDPGMRKALAFLLTAKGLPVREFASAEAFLAECPADAEGCCLLDVRMPGMDGLTLQAQLAERGIRLPIVFLTGHASVPMAVRAMAEGAVDFLEKPCDEHRLLAGVRRAMETSRQWATARQQRQDFLARCDALSPREREVMALLTAGKTTKQIAAQLEISAQAVDKHRNKILEKMAVETLVELSRLIERFGVEQ